MNTVFSGKRALVVGGSGGIGAAVSIKLAEMGAEVFVHGGHSEERLRQTVKKIHDVGGKAEGFLYSADKTDAAEAILAKVPSPDILVCSWGPFLQKPLADMSADHWENIIKSNIIFPGVLVSSVLCGMMKRQWGRILLFGGTNTDTIRGFSTSAAYSAAKTALGVIAKSAALQAGPSGVTCNVICPGLVETEYVDDAMKDYIKTRSPAGKVETPADIAEFAAAILSMEQLNGAVVPLDYGLKL